MNQEMNQTESWKDEEKDKAMLILLATVLNEYPKEDERYVQAINAALKYFPEIDWSDYE